MSDIYTQQCENFKSKMKEIAEQAFDEIVSDRLPWLESDTQQNVELRTQDVVSKLLAGKCLTMKSLASTLLTYLK
jgi:hypothetical protein